MSFSPPKRFFKVTGNPGFQVEVVYRGCMVPLSPRPFSASTFLKYQELIYIENPNHWTSSK